LVEIYGRFGKRFTSTCKKEKHTRKKGYISVEEVVNFYETKRRQITKDRQVAALSVGCGSLTNH